MFPDLPWDVHPDLTEERLTFVGQLLYKARNNAVAHHVEEIGDNGWTLGCKAFAYSHFELSQAANSGDDSWLTVADPSTHFVFKIGAVPVRFYRGDSDTPNPRTLAVSFPEFEQLALIFPDDDRRQHLIYRFAVLPDIDGSALEVKFVGLDGATALLNWTVPLDRSVPALVGIGIPAEGVTLPPPAVSIPGKKQETKPG